MSFRLLRAVESPNYDRAAISARFPGWTLIGAKSGWFYPVEQTRCVFVATSWGSLVKTVRAHLEGNALPLPASLDATMQDWWCRNVTSVDCAEPITQEAMAKAVSLQTLAKRFLQSMIAWARSGEGFVPQEEAERRAAICVGCPKHGVVECRGGCGFTLILNTAMAFFGAKETKQGDALKQCQVCGCFLKASVHVPLAAQQYDDLQGQWPADHPCWHKPVS